MSHFAEIDENNRVIRVTIGDNDDPAGDEGYSWLVNNLGGRWIQTSYNSNFRGNYAGPGYVYDEELDVFYSPQPFPSWTLNSAYTWEAPIERPIDRNKYDWNEESLSWIVNES